VHPSPDLVEIPPESPAAPPATPAGPLPAEFAALYEAHSQQIFYLALRLLGDPSQAEDATHDVFMKAWRNFGGFRGEAEVRTWLYRITLNHCSNLRSSWHARNVHTQSDETIFENAVGATDSPFREVEMSELGKRIRTALEELPEEYRVLLLLVADQELSYDEVAQLTHQSTDAVRGKLHRARKAFGNAFRKTA
jgi:RNA polymerase sigma-70 factor (ECF subfamily)